MIDFTIKFVPEDCWIGAYWKKETQITKVYICIVPCFPLILTFIRK